MKYVYLTLNWIFGLVFLFLGVLMLFNEPIMGLFFLVASSLLLPPIRGFVNSKTNYSLSAKHRAISVTAAILLALVSPTFTGSTVPGPSVPDNRTDSNSELLALRAEQAQYFRDNRDTVISMIKNSLARDDFENAAAESNKYLHTDDAELAALNHTARELLAEKRKQALIGEKIARLKDLPVENFRENHKLYQELTELVPGNAEYINKRDFYASKIKEEESHIAATEARQERIRKQFSAWDGAHYGLEKVIKKAMHNPDSYEHVETKFGDRGDHLIVQTVYRGSNAFGGIVTNSVTAKVSLNGTVLEIIEE
ncbi:hypothetical protein ACFOD1_07535 [Pseudidiomarina halophila]|uniref:Uncharacterized protein n=1 Tax=Pseudidiomarina halophila TaxID=1449799 RepID=A0A432XR96_9GAMM|nr:hypothetical protein [Pseudidiomarina halophila]RUO51249.1 hypothetical protein CWI69_12030 [Pseudidiomarina halophila]